MPSSPASLPAPPDAPTTPDETTAGRLTAVLRHPLPSPPERFRVGPFRGEPSAPSAAHDVRSARVIGTATGLSLLVCLVTGLISHLHQHPIGWLDIPSRPVWGYQLTQGLHVACGIALVPLVLAKLWIVFPRLFTWPPARSVGHALERAMIAPLVAGTLFELVSGLINIVQWYPWRFYFPRTHWAVAWVVAGSVLVHLAVKAPLLRPGAGRAESAAPGESDETEAQTVTAVPPSQSRRALVLGVGAAVGVATAVTVGQTVAPLSRFSVLAPRRPDTAPGGVPINRTAADAGVRTAAADTGWRLTVTGPRTLSLGLADLAAMPQYDARLPIACVEGWSATALWSGVRLRDVLDLAGVAPENHLRVVSLERTGLYGLSSVGPSAARDPLTLLAMRLAGEPLSLDHGYPLRLIAPNRPGVLQTKWLARIEVAPA